MAEVEPAPERDQRSARSAKLCRLLSKRISEVTTPGLGHWGPAWDIVRDASERLLDALSAWERTGDEELMDRAKTVSLEVLEAWTDADRRHRESVDLVQPKGPDRAVSPRRLDPLSGRSTATRESSGASHRYTAPRENP